MDLPWGTSIYNNNIYFACLSVRWYPIQVKTAEPIGLTTIFCYLHIALGKGCGLKKIFVSTFFLVISYRRGCGKALTRNLARN